MVIAATGKVVVDVLLQSAQVRAAEVVVLLVVSMASTGRDEVVPVQSAQVDEAAKELDSSMAAMGALGLPIPFPTSDGVTVMVLWTTSVTVTYLTEQGLAAAGIIVTVSVRVDCRVIVVVASVLAAATWLATPASDGVATAEGRVMVAYMVLVM